MKLSYFKTKKLSVICQFERLLALPLTAGGSQIAGFCEATSYRPMTSLPACENLAKPRIPSFLADRVL